MRRICDKSGTAPEEGDWRREGTGEVVEDIGKDFLSWAKLFDFVPLISGNTH